MRYLGIDLGSKTVGLAMSDPTGTIASSFKTIYFDNEEYELAYVTINKLQNLCEAKNYSFDFTALLKIIKEICILNEKKNEESIRLVESRKDMDIESKKAILKACIKNPKNVSALIALLNIYITVL